MKMTNLFLEVTSETWTNGNSFVTSSVVTFKWPAWVLAGTIVVLVLIFWWLISRRKGGITDNEVKI